MYDCLPMQSVVFDSNLTADDIGSYCSPKCYWFGSNKIVFKDFAVLFEQSINNRQHFNFDVENINSALQKQKILMTWIKKRVVKVHPSIFWPLNNIIV